jgi:hypothetical protein
MTENSDMALQREIAALRRDLRIVRTWARFIGCGVVLVLVRVSWPLIEASHLVPILIWVAGFVGLIFAVACILSHVLPKAPQRDTGGEKGGA